MTISVRPPVALLIPMLALVALCVVPLVYVFVRAFGGGAAEAFETVFSSSIASLIARSMSLVFVVTIASLALAFVLAFLTSVTDLPGKRFWTVISVAPFAVPCYVGASALIAAASPRGLIGMACAWLGFEGPLSISGFVPAAIVLTLFTYPYAYLPLRAAFLRIDRSTIEASRALGKGRYTTMRRVVIPQLVPAMLDAVSVEQLERFVRSMLGEEVVNSDFHFGSSTRRTRAPRRRSSQARDSRAARTLAFQ